ncbi:MAG TPA: PQQ-binding-like beta-propeller repeat protein [Solirubrobacterales bacterium]|jgi:outer membrane protein assembly factor BamB|nr:PQQ-binding-like beta-propeller repeat protein [Solirubrobacterales bacterium]
MSRHRAVSLAALILVVGALATGCGSSSSSSSPSHSFTGDAYPGVDAAATRHVESPIYSGNVNRLKVAWSIPIAGKGANGSYASTPAIVNGVVYSQDLESNVQAIDLESGDVLWEKMYESPSHGPNGLAIADGRVYGATASEAFALDQKSGKGLWKVSLGGTVDMAPGVDGGRVYASTVPQTPDGEEKPGAVGTLWALDGKTGKKLWHFDTAPEGLWGKPKINSGGGIWYPPSFDEKGDAYVGTGSPAPAPGTAEHPWGSSRPGRNLYTDSMLKLDPDTGKLLWYYQETPHDIYGWDFQNSPIVTESGNREVAIGSGKAGFVVAVDVKTGKLVWRMHVGIHNGHDKDPLYALRGEDDRIRTGRVEPGLLGGVIAPLASDDERVYVPIVDRAMTLRSGSEVAEGNADTGEVTALDLETGGILWESSLNSPIYGALLAVNDLVFATSAEGFIHALNVNSGSEVWGAKLPSGSNAGVMISGDMLVTGAGRPTADGRPARLVAYKLGG